MGKMKQVRISLVVSWILVLLFNVTLFAQSQRISPDAGYAVQDINMTAPYTIGYSGGLDVVYADISTMNHSNRAFVHEHMKNDYQTTEIVLFNYNGERTKLLFTATGWPQAVKKIGNRIWFSYTGAEGAGFYSIPWDKTLSSYPASSARPEVIVDYNWEVEQAPDGKIFICGAEGMSGGQKISYVDTENNNTVIPVIIIGGNSSGFAIDSEGNIWSGEYVLGWSPSMHIEPCRLGMWSKEKVENAIATGTPLTWDDADVVIPLGSTDITGQTTNWGPNDIEADSQGNIYVSMNTYSSWNSSSEYGRVIKISPDGSGNYTITELGQTVQRINKWDWARTLAFDGTSDINTAAYTDPTKNGPSANILFLDMDMTQCDDVDQVVAIVTDQDYDSDGVPDAVDNAPETYNPEQVDTDGDMYGNICDADFDNDGYVGIQDFNIFSSNYNQTVPPGNPDVDMDGGDYIGPSDFAEFQSRYNSSAPWF